MEGIKTQNDHVELAQKSLDAIKQRIAELELALREQRALARSFKNFIEKWSQKTYLEQPPTISTKME